MIQAYHHERFNFFVAMIVIAIISLAALSRYSLMAADARILRLQIISHHFMTGAANTRIQFLISNMANAEQAKRSSVDKPLYFSPQGWPVSTSGPIASNYQPTDEDCYQLWQLFLQNPAPITKGATAKSRKEYRAFSLTNNCRYEFSDGTAYFDYFPLDGRLIFIPTPH